jgi:hypothetical protein
MAEYYSSPQHFGQGEGEVVIPLAFCSVASAIAMKTGHPKVTRLLAVWLSG